MLRLLASASAVALLSTAAYSADFPLPEEPIPEAVVVPAYDWSGIYLGLQGGWKFGEDDYEVTGADTSFDVDGPMIGGHVGGNMQMGNFVFGVEGDGEWADVDGTFTAGNGDEVSTSIDWQASLRGRVGLAWDRLLIYGTGGAAFAGTENRIFDCRNRDRGNRRRHPLRMDRGRWRRRRSHAEFVGGRGVPLHRSRGRGLRLSHFPGGYVHVRPVLPCDSRAGFLSVRRPRPVNRRGTELQKPAFGQAFCFAGPSFFTRAPNERR